jgi:Uma2 family endonuclease
VRDKSKLDGKSCNGAPDMIAEILSPSNTKHDTIVKFRLYQKYGVKEYWVVDPRNKTVSVHILENGKYFTFAYEDRNVIPVHVLAGCRINLADVFKENEEVE